MEPWMNLYSSQMQLQGEKNYNRRSIFSINFELLHCPRTVNISKEKNYLIKFYKYHWILIICQVLSPLIEGDS